MNAKLLMTASAIGLGATGMVLTFAPGEALHFLNLTGSSPILLQIIGALYFGFAMLNWTAKANLVGGIYGRPIAIANFTHFLIGGLALIKWVLHHAGWTYISVFAVFYLTFALLFGWVFFTNPVLTKKAI